MKYAYKAIILVLLSLTACTEPKTDLALQYGTVLPTPRPLAEFQLVDQHGDTFSNANLRGNWTVVFSGFTYCPDICPLTLGQLQAAEQEMTGEKKHRVVFVTVDPQRDTVSSLKQYLNFFEPNWTALTGTNTELSALLDSLGMSRVRIPAVSGENYSIEHSTALVLLDPHGRMAGYWKAPLNTTKLAADFSALPVP
jgi:protein SCO1